MKYCLIDEAHYPIRWYGPSPSEAPILIFKNSAAALAFQKEIEASCLAEDFGVIKIESADTPYYDCEPLLDATHLSLLSIGDSVKLIERQEN